MQTSLQGIAQKAKTNKRHRFRNLYGMLNEEYLLKCWQGIRKEAAYGVDRVSAEEYERNLVGNVRLLIERLKRKSYRAKLVRRQYIPKESGKLRPLGIPAVEDKLLQLSVAWILEAIYEQDFLECSFGYRPKKGVHDAMYELTRRLQFGRYGYVVEADIKGYFDNIDHDWMIRMLEQRIDDKPFMRLIRKWLKAGVLDTDGKVLHPMTGTPQGGIVSPVLANLYLHYVLDLWFEKMVKPWCRGDAFLIRYADDYVCAFETERDAKGFYTGMDKRLTKFGLKLSEEKTRVIGFNRKGKSRFEFLGFEYWWGKDRKGRDRLKRRTSRKKLRSSLKRFTEWCRENRRLKLADLFTQLNAKLRGYYNHYGVIGNYQSLHQFHRQVERILFKWLNRRSQRKSIYWRDFQQLTRRHHIFTPRILARPRPTMPILI
jgi:RNA-directed DNA polymerase